MRSVQLIQLQVCVLRMARASEEMFLLCAFRNSEATVSMNSCHATPKLEYLTPLSYHSAPLAALPKPPLMYLVYLPWAFVLTERDHLVGDLEGRLLALHVGKRSLPSRF